MERYPRSLVGSTAFIAAPVVSEGASLYEFHDTRGTVNIYGGEKGESCGLRRLLRHNEATVDVIIEACRSSPGTPRSLIAGI